MKVKEVLEILHSNDKNVSEKELIIRLENIDVEDATLETELSDDVLKKLSLKYEVSFKKPKEKKETKTTSKQKAEPQVETPAQPVKEEKVEPVKEEKVEAKKEDKKETKAEPKKEEPKKEKEVKTLI